MPRDRTEYHFTLPRRKRIGGVLCRLPIGLVGLWFVSIAFRLILYGEWWAVFPALLALLLSRGLIVSVTRFITHKDEMMCLAVEENGVGFGEHKPDWWLFADGITGLMLGKDGFWQLTHVNGTYLYFPADVVSQADIDHLKSKIDNGSTKAMK